MEVSEYLHIPLFSLRRWRFFCGTLMWMSVLQIDLLYFRIDFIVWKALLLALSLQCQIKTNNKLN